MTMRPFRPISSAGEFAILGRGNALFQLFVLGGDLLVHLLVPDEVMKDEKFAESGS